MDPWNALSFLVNACLLLLTTLKIAQVRTLGGGGVRVG